jgi:hypothetical protein
MSSFLRILTTLSFVASMAISLALAVYSAQWSDERAEALREVRTMANGLAMAGLCIGLLMGKKRTSARR